MKQWDGVYKILSPFTKRLGPDGKVHEGWCAIFEREVVDHHHHRLILF